MQCPPIVGAVIFEPRLGWMFVLVGGLGEPGQVVTE